MVDTAAALGIRLERVTANPALLYLPHEAGPLTRFAKDVIMRLVARRYGQVKSSTLHSLARGRKTEIGFLNGYVVDRAAEAGVAVPLNAALTAMIHEVEAGARPITPGNLRVLQASEG